MDNLPGPSNAIRAIMPPPTNDARSDRRREEDDNLSPIPFFENIPEGVLIKIFDLLSVEDIKNCRLVCFRWDYTILLSELLDMKSCFVFDGRKDDNYGGKCAAYMRDSQAKNYYWSHLKFRRVGGRQTPWLFEHIDRDPDFVFVSQLELLNCSMNWLIILQLMMNLPNLEVFIDCQDMYCWDYQTFNGGIEEDEQITDNNSFLQLKNREKLENLEKLRVAKIHRNQLAECTTYIKMLRLKCENLKELEMTTDQNFAPQRASQFYNHLYGLLFKNRNSLKVLRFPYKLICPTYDFRITDEHHCFREFLNHVTERRWHETLRMRTLEELSLQFGIIPVENQDLKTKLVPLLMSFTGLRKFSMQCILLESGMERFIEEFLRELSHTRFKLSFGVYMNDAAGVPNILNYQSYLRSLSIQTFREMAKQFKDLIPAFGIENYSNLKELQYFCKNHTFRNFNLDLLIESFSNLTHLNLVDHNSRLETRHSCEALATIEDPDMQLIITRLDKLVSFQLIANLTFLTDTGLTGIDRESCKRMHVQNVFTSAAYESAKIEGSPLSRLCSFPEITDLRFLVLRGLGIKVTDVTAHFAFNGMSKLKKLHLYGCHQVSPTGRALLSQKFSVTRGCDLQV